MLSIVPDLVPDDVLVMLINVSWMVQPVTIRNRLPVTLMAILEDVSLRAVKTRQEV